jgi:hypothetical protein
LFEAWLANSFGLVVMEILWKEEPVVAAGITEHTATTITVMRPKEHAKLSGALSTESCFLWVLKNGSLCKIVEFKVRWKRKCSRSEKQKDIRNERAFYGVISG